MLNTIEDRSWTPETQNIFIVEDFWKLVAVTRQWPRHGSRKCFSLPIDAHVVLVMVLLNG